MRSLKISVTDIFNETIRAKTKIIVNEGGARSSKTWSFLQFLIMIAFSQKNVLVGSDFQTEILRQYFRPKSPYKFTISREKLTWIKATILKDFFEMIELYGLLVYPEPNINRSDQTYYLYGNEFAFVGVDEVKKFHGRKQDILHFNEALEISKKDFQQGVLRTSLKVFVDYNPSLLEHFIYDMVIPRDDCTFIQSTIEHNPFAPQATKKELEMWGDPTSPAYDPVSYKIYGLGLRAQQTGLIFPDCKLVKEFPEDCQILGYGLDFGYVNNVTALGKIGIQGDNLYFEQLIYEIGLLNIPVQDERTGELKKNISDELEKVELKKYSDEIFADLAEEKSIDEIYSAGWNIKGAEKGPGSVMKGIEILKRYNLFIVESSINWIKEKNNYKWKVDKNDKVLNEPVKAWNHLWDGARYVVMETLGAVKEISYIIQQPGKVYRY
ncbi:hypothetical protein ES703_18804 [subsurface metagenome]